MGGLFSRFFKTKQKPIQSFGKSKLSLAQNFAVNVVKAGPVPQHLACIMDGNRRFARANKIKVAEGHKLGYEKLKDVVSWCMALEIKYLTVYAFSIENFKRTQAEVDNLMQLANAVFDDLYEQRDFLNSLGAAVKVIGNLKLLPTVAQQKIAKIVLETENNPKFLLTLAIAYTSREEIVSAIKTINRGVKERKLRKRDVNSKLLEKALYTENLPEVDFMIRTSGERKLSDFLLWQSATSIMYFTKTNWPSVSFWRFIYGMFYYQYHRKSMLEVREKLERREENRLTVRGKLFLKKLSLEREKDLVKMKGGNQK